MTINHNSHHRRTRKIINSFEARALKKRPLASKIADCLTSSFGTVSFLMINLIIFVVWIGLNIGMLSKDYIFDPFPFVLLITTVSLEAILLAVIVLISQNRENQIATLRDELQLQVEFITEKEITKSLQLQKLILKKLGHEINDYELEEMLNEVDASYIERKLEDQLQTKA